MKSLTEIQNAKQDGDYEIIAQALGQSPETIKKKLAQVRADKGKEVQRAFSILLAHREQSNNTVIANIRRALRTTKKLKQAA